MKKIVLILVIFCLSLMADDFEMKLLKINNFVNTNIQYVSDEVNYKKVDYWASPSETLKRKRGDCEDFAILKYSLLLKNGVDEKDIYMAFTFYNGQGHVYLVVKHNGKKYYLDNIDKNIYVNHHKEAFNVFATNNKFNKQFVAASNRAM